MGLGFEIWDLGFEDYLKVRGSAAAEMDLNDFARCRDSRVRSTRKSVTLSAATPLCLYGISYCRTYGFQLRVIKKIPVWLGVRT